MEQVRVRIPKEMVRALAAWIRNNPQEGYSSVEDAVRDALRRFLD